MQNKQKNNVQDSQSSDIMCPRSPSPIFIQPKDIQILFEELNLQGDQSVTIPEDTIEEEPCFWDKDNLETEEEEEAPSSKRTYADLTRHRNRNRRESILSIISSACRKPSKRCWF